MAQESKTGSSDIAIVIGPIKTADYLNQPNIVTRESGNKIKMADFDQWAGSFQDNLKNALAENIGFLVGTEKIYEYPVRQSAGPIDYRVAMNVTRFDGKLGEEASLVVRWSLLGGKQKKVLGVKRSSIREPTRGPGYEDLVAAQSRALSALSLEIAKAIKTAEQNADR
jgi:uncharacterized lipoprotein YmbA